jgi:DNA polymerase III delta prime subunit
MEEYSDTNLFVFTCNDINRVIDPIRSRVYEVNIANIPIKSCLERCLHILKKEKIEINEKNKAILSEKIKNYFPDIRKIIFELQASLDFSFNLHENNQGSEKIAENIFKKIQSLDFIETRKYVIENEKNFDSDYQGLLKKICELVFYSELDPEIRKKIFIEISETLYKSRIVLDQEINFSSCVARMQEILKL